MITKEEFENLKKEDRYSIEHIAIYINRGQFMLLQKHSYSKCGVRAMVLVDYLDFFGLCDVTPVFKNILGYECEGGIIKYEDYGCKTPGKFFDFVVENLRSYGLEISAKRCGIVWDSIV